MFDNSEGKHNLMEIDIDFVNMRKVYLYRIVGILSYLNVPQHSYNMSRKMVAGDLGVISFRYVTMADHEGLGSLIAFVKELERKGIKIILTGFKVNTKRKILSEETLLTEFRKRTFKNVVGES